MWQPGDVVVFRLVETPVTAAMVHAINGDPALIQGIPFLANGKITTFAARPYIVVKDTEEVTVLFGPENTACPRWEIESQRYVSQSRTKGQTLRFLYPDKAYDITLMFEAEGEPPWYYDSLFGQAGFQPGWRTDHEVLRNTVQSSSTGGPGTFRGWYVNLQTPFVRRSFGFDTADLTLDIIVRPDRSWYWKDEDELQMAVSKGACSEEYARQIRAAGEEVIDLIESAASPFNGEWTAWVPASNAKIVNIPDGWQSAPVLDLKG